MTACFGPERAKAVLGGYRPRYGSIETVCESVSWLVKKGSVQVDARLHAQPVSALAGAVDTSPEAAFCTAKSRTNDNSSPKSLEWDSLPCFGVCNRTTAVAAHGVNENRVTAMTVDIYSALRRVSELVGR
jgi:hypothetical protein